MHLHGYLHRLITYGIYSKNEKRNISALPSSKKLSLFNPCLYPGTSSPPVAPLETSAHPSQSSPQQHASAAGVRYRSLNVLTLLVAIRSVFLRIVEVGPLLLGGQRNLVQLLRNSSVVLRTRDSGGAGYIGAYGR